MIINSNLKKLSKTYLFTQVTEKVANYKKLNPEVKLINLGVGDYTLPLCDAVVKKLREAVNNLSKKETFRGYGPEEGYLFLRESIKKYYKTKGVDLDTDEIFISDGANSDIGNVLEIFSRDNPVLIPDPVYPAYVDANIIHGRKIEYLNATQENNFLPGIPKDEVKSRIIYICSPNNPTGATYNYSQLKAFVDYALETESVIMFDAAYESFIKDQNLPSSIFSIEGAKKCAIEICSFSKIAGFTGVRCGYTVIPEEMVYEDSNMNKIYKRRLAARFNGVSYISQMGANAVFSREGTEQVNKNLDYFRKNAKILSSVFEKKGIFYTGAKNSPYIWFKCPSGMSSWDFFDYLLEKFNIVGTPGVGFGKNGENFFRLSSFGTLEETELAAERLLKL